MLALSATWGYFKQHGPGACCGSCASHDSCADLHSFAPPLLANGLLPNARRHIWGHFPGLLNLVLNLCFSAW